MHSKRNPECYLPDEDEARQMTEQQAEDEAYAAQMAAAWQAWYEESA